LEGLLDADTLRRLRPHLTHTGSDGQPCVEADRLDDLLQLLARREATATAPPQPDQDRWVSDGIEADRLQEREGDQ
jgi:hypothetical protein